MVDRRLTNCPLCGRQNAIFMYRTDVGSGQTIATCSSCNGVIRVNPPDSPPLSPFSSPGFTNSSPMSQARILSSQESNDDPAFELTQPVTNSQSSIRSEPSSPDSRPSSNERALRGPPSVRRPIRDQPRGMSLNPSSRVSVRRANRRLNPQAIAAREALNTFEGRRNVAQTLGSNQRFLDGIARVDAANPVPETARERAQRLADADAAVASAAAVPLPSSLANPPAMMHKVSEAFELKKKIQKAQRNHPSRQPAAKYLLFEYNKKNKTNKPRKAYDVYLGDTPITELLKDKDEDGDPQDNIIIQRDTEPYNAVSIPKDYLKNLLTTNNYFNHTKYQCSDTINESLDITEDDIVFDKENREIYQFINGKALNIHDGLFLRTQLLSILNSKKKYFLFHVHKINITPIASADKVRWLNPPKRIKGWTDIIPDWNSYERSIPLNEAHMEVGDMVSADHCQKGFTNFLITIAPMKNSRTAQFYSNRTKTKRMGGRRKTKKKKSKKNKRKKSRRRRKQKGGNYIKFDDIEFGKTYDVRFSKDFVDDTNNHPMSENMTHVKFEKMSDHQPGYFKLTFLHQKDGGKEEHILYEGNEYGWDGIVYAKRKSGNREELSADAGGRRKTKRKKKKRKKKKGKKSRKKR
tara:strand:+ start:44869 stop:46776 length:1908 start_codon:yes stop_codon:yes gene_type:complete